jgi:PPP family 3-phenylpropionic acid transporter
VGARLALLYVAVFVQIGVAVPFWPLWLKSQGLDEVQIGWLLACGQWGRVVVNPAIAHHADRRGALRGALLATCGAAALLFVPFFWVRGFPALLVTFVLFQCTWSAVVPLLDALALHAQRERGLDYGRVRVFGSLAFAGAALAAGVAVERWGAGVTPYVLLATVAASGIAALAAPALGGAPVSERPRLPVAELARHRGFLLMVAGAALISASHAVYYGFATLRWQAAGWDEDTIGLLWTTGVATESVLFLGGRRLVARLGPIRLVLAGAVASVARWTLLGAAVPPALTFAAQALHGLTFAATHWGVMLYLREAVPAAIVTSAQSVYAAVAGGLVLGCATLAAGPLVRAWGDGAYHVMTVLAAVGAGAAWAARAQREPRRAA